MKTGILLINKPNYKSSRYYDNVIKAKFNTSKVGHLGTLDPFASGLLIIAVGSATKVLPYINDDTKEYIATLSLGKETDTLDLNGEIINTKDVPNLNKEKVIEILNSFLGESLQYPPIYSAIKINGKPLYRYALENEKIDISPRKINIYEMELLSIDNNDITFRCKVSKGTYIRSLGIDIAKKLETIGFLKELKRTKIANISVENATDIDNINEASLLPIEDFINMKVINATDGLKRRILNGLDIKLTYENDEYIYIKYQDEPLAIYQKKEDGLYIPKRGLW